MLRGQAQVDLAKIRKARKKEAEIEAKQNKNRVEAVQPESGAVDKNPKNEDNSGGTAGVQVVSKP